MKRAAARPMRPIELVMASVLAPACETGELVELALLPEPLVGVPVAPAVEPPPVLLPEPVSGTVPALPALVSPPAELEGTALASCL